MQWNIFRERRFWLSSLVIVMLLGISAPSFAQEGENFCRSQIAQTIEYGETMAGVIDAQVGVAFFCFDGERGDNVTITVEVTDGRLIPELFITDPVFDEEDLQNPLGVGRANREGGSAIAEFAIDTDDTFLIVVYGLENTLGAFDLTIEASASSILGGGSDDEETEEPNENPDDPDNNGGGGVDMSQIEFGVTNLCRLDSTEFLEYGDSASGEMDSEFVAFWYCFEGQAGDVVTVEVGTLSGDLVMVGLIADPFFDLTENTVYAVDIATSRSDSAEVEFEIPEDGDYLIWVQLGEGEAGEYYVELSGEATVPLDCGAAPLGFLINQQWMIAPAEGEEPLVLINLSCDGQIVVSTMGAPEVGIFEIDDEGGMSFVYGNTLFTTVSLDESSWTIANVAGIEYKLVPVPDTNCSDESVTALTHATWQYGNSETAAFLSFTCNGLVVVNVQGQTGIQAYTYVDGTISIDLGEDTTIDFEGVVIDDSELNATVDGNEVSLVNVLAE